MDKELAQLFANLAAIAVMTWIGRIIYVKRPGIFSNRLKTIKKERAEDENAAAL